MGIRDRVPLWCNHERSVSSLPFTSNLASDSARRLIETMSVDLDWDNLTSELASSLVEILNRQLSSVTRPSFIGPVEVLSFEFGNVPPDVEVIDIRNVHPDFLEDEEDEEDDPARSDRPAPPTRPDQPHQPEHGFSSRPTEPLQEGSIDMEDNFEWVSRKALRGKGLEDGCHPPYPSHPLSHLPEGAGRASPRPGVMDTFGSTHSLHRGVYSGSPWSPAMPNLLDLRATSYYPPSMVQGLRGSAYGGSISGSRFGSRKPSPKSRSPHLPTPDTQNPTNQGPDTSTNSDSQSMKREHPNLQLHLHISWESNLRLTLITSLLINYPSPMFMTLPIKLSITGLVFDGQLAVAYQGEKRRVHLCILDELDPYVPSAPHRNRDSGVFREKSNLNSPVVISSSQSQEDLTSSPAPTPSPLNPRPRAVPLSHQGSEDSIMREEGERNEKPLPIGQRLLPNIYIESEIGQADKHVLKNVTRVERFIQDVIRKSIVEELVFPNFHTLILGDGP